jgi:hypothetical protein
MPKWKSITIIFIGLALTTIAFGAKSKSGDYKNGILTDSQMGYTMVIPDNWRVKVFNEPSIQRVLMIKRNYEINKTVKELGGEFTIPEIRVFARPDSMTPAEFLDKLKGDVDIHKTQDDIISQLELLSGGEFSQAQDIVLDSIPAIKAIFKKNYERKLEVDPNDAHYRQYGGLLVQNEHLVHELYIFKRNGRLFVIHAFAEREFYPINKDEFNKIIGSISFAAAGTKAALPPPLDTGK